MKNLLTALLTVFGLSVFGQGWTQMGDPLTKALYNDTGAICGEVPSYSSGWGENMDVYTNCLFLDFSALPPSTVELTWTVITNRPTPEHFNREIIYSPKWRPDLTESSGWTDLAPVTNSYSDTNWLSVPVLGTYRTNGYYTMTATEYDYSLGANVVWHYSTNCIGRSQGEPYWENYNTTNIALSPVSFAKNIAKRSDGVYALCGNSSYYYQNMVNLWTNGNDLNTIYYPRILLQSPVQSQFWSSNLCVLSYNGAFGPTTISELAITPSAVTTLLNLPFGDGNTTASQSTSCTLSNGGVLFITQCNSNQALVIFDMAYRNPNGQNGAESTNWWTGRIVLGGAVVAPGFWISANLTALQGPDGNVWVFMNQDASGTVGLARFSVSNNAVQLIDYDGAEIPRYTSASPSGELIKLGSALDTFSATNRIILSYENTNSSLYSQHYDRILTAVYADKSYEPIANIPWPVANWAELPIPVWPRPEGIYLAGHISAPTDDSRLFQLIGAGYNYTLGLRSAPALVGDSVIASSNDGWVLVNHSPVAGQTWYQLKKLHF